MTITDKITFKVTSNVEADENVFNNTASLNDIPYYQG